MHTDKDIDIDEYKDLLDPVVFVETCLPRFVPNGLRPFQKEILSCRDKQVVMRIGRRSGKTHLLACKAIFEALTNENFRVAVITPTEEQGKVIFDMIVTKVLALHPEINDCVESTRQSPGKIKFKRGSRISFFTAGTRTGSGALNVRGQGADLIIIDEADYLSALDLEAILALKIEHRDIAIWASSTPTGKRSHFYYWCTDKSLGWTEFHYGSPDAIPDWNEETESFARKHFTSYEKEVLAEFGTEETGVFNKHKVDEACIRGEGHYIYEPLYFPYYGYPQMPVDNDVEARTFGVDWDKYGAPTNILILDLLHNGMYKVAYRTEIEQNEYTLTNAVKRIIELNDIWKPHYIYIDKGFGEVQSELLKLHGEKHKETGLSKKVVPIAFGSNIEVFDPVTNKREKKEAKHLMVNLLQMTIDEDKLILNPRDNVMKTQLINYCVVRYGVSGKPIFTDKDEHCVDALMLAHLAIVMNFGGGLSEKLFKPSTDGSVVYKHSDINNKSASVLRPGKQAVRSNYSSYTDFALDKPTTPRLDMYKHGVKRKTFKSVRARNIMRSYL